MSLLDKLRQRGPRATVYLSEDGADRSYAWMCQGCSVEVAWDHESDAPAQFPHATDCMSVLYPRIVAALEAAENAVDAWEDTHDGAPDYGVMSALRMSLRGKETTV